MSLETLLPKTTENPNFQKPYNHFNEVPGRLKLLQGKDGKYHETRREDEPDFVLLEVGYGDLPNVRRVRGQYDARLATKPELQAMFYGAIDDEDVHRTVHRVGEYRKLTSDQLHDLVDGLKSSAQEIDVQEWQFGVRPVVSDGILLEIDDESRRNNETHPSPTVIDIANVALRGAGLREIDGRPLSHSTDRYARCLPEDMKLEIQQFLQDANIAPATIRVPGIYVAVNWPVRDDADNIGTYKYKIIEFIPFAGADREEGLSVVRDKLFVPDTELWTPAKR